MLEESLNRLAGELDALSNNSSYEEAFSLNSQYVQSNEFRLVFLRCDLWDAEKAALRIERYLAYMKRHFGTVALARPVFFSDLDKTEEDLLRAGNFQILPTRDSVGRRVVVRLGDLGGADVTLFNKVGGDYPEKRKENNAISSA